MTRAAIIIAAFASFLLGGTAVHAQAPGYYLGASGAAVWTDAARSVATESGGVHDESTPNGWKVFGGRIWERFGIEFAYYNLGEYDIVDGAGALLDQLTTTAIGVSGVYTAPIAPGYYFNAKLGLAFTDAKYDCKASCTSPFVDTNRRGTSGLLGIGLAMRAVSNLWLRLEYEHVGSVQHAISNIRFNDGYDMLSVGVHIGF